MEQNLNLPLLRILQPQPKNGPYHMARLIFHIGFNLNVVELLKSMMDSSTTLDGQVMESFSALS